MYAKYSRTFLKNGKFSIFHSKLMSPMQALAVRQDVWYKKIKMVQHAVRKFNDMFSYMNFDTFHNSDGWKELYATLFQ